MIKFKEAGNGHFIRISLDDEGKETSRTATFSEASKPKTMGAGFYAEMQEWLKITGNKIEPQYTPEELEAKEAADTQQDLDSQNSELIRLLNESEIHVSNDPPYPDDVSKWVTARGKWRTLLKSNKMGEIDPKPF